MTAVDATNAPPAKAIAAQAEAAEVHIYQHSDLLYWWVVWLYGFICAGLTHFQGVKVEMGTHGVLVHPSPWVGISMIGLILFVIVVTNVKARGVYSLTLVLFMALLVGAIQYVYSWEQIFAYFPLLRVHANLAFYLTLSIPLCIVWFIVILGMDHLNYWYFRPGEVGTRNVVGEGSEAYVAMNIQLIRHSHDLFVHRILGLWFLGFGTGDMDVSFSTPQGQKNYTMKNVWRIGKRESQIKKMMSAREFFRSGE